MTEHKYADILRAIADGTEIEYRINKDYAWCTLREGEPLYYLNQGVPRDNIRVKPEKAYPTTSYTDQELKDFYYYYDGTDKESLVALANAVLKRYIDEQAAA